jgi:hypothetical protein
MALGSTQSLTEMSTRNLPGGKGRPARRADNLTAVSRLSRQNVGASTSLVQAVKVPLFAVIYLFNLFSSPLLISLNFPFIYVLRFFFSSFRFTTFFTNPDYRLIRITPITPN